MKKERALVPSWTVWIIGTIITAGCPFLAAYYSFRANDGEGLSYVDFLSLSDTLAFVLSVSVNCIMLSFDSRRIKSIVFRRILLAFSSISAFISGSWYFHAAALDSVNRYSILVPLIIICLINIVMGGLFEYKSIKKPKQKEARGNS